MNKRKIIRQQYHHKLNKVQNKKVEYSKKIKKTLSFKDKKRRTKRKKVAADKECNSFQEKVI